MKKLTPTAGRFGTVVAAATVLAVFGGGSAVAGSLVTSAKIKNNTVQSVDVRDNNLRSRDVLDGSLTGIDLGDGSVSGIDVGDASLTGADVKDGSLSHNDIGVFYASVYADGTVASSSGDVTVVKPATGRYGVRFAGHDVRQCAFTATPAAPTGILAPLGFISAIDELNHPEGAYLFTRDKDGADQDMGFHLTVVC